MAYERPSQRTAADTAWTQVLAALAESIDEREMSHLLTRLRPTALDRHTLHLEAPDRFSLLSVREQFLDRIREAVTNLVGPRQIVLDLRGQNQGELFPVGRRRGDAIDGDGLDAGYTFARFVVGSSNQFAHAACRAVARQPGAHYNPLVLYGGHGLGKTHLAAAIGHEVLAAHPDAKIAFLTLEKFMTDLISSLQRDRMVEFKRRFRAVDVLIVDDVQSLAGRDRTQEEFFHTFNALHAAGRQVVLTSDRIPDDIRGLEERLRNRFQWGLVADIQAPDLETRVAIIERKAELDGLSISRDAAMLLADRVRSNVRALEGALTRLAVQASMEQRMITATYVESLLEQGTLGRHGPLTFSDIAGAVCSRYGLSQDQLLSRRRSKDIALSRQVAMYLCRRLLKVSYPKLGELFDRDHSTALHGVRSIQARLKRDPVFHETVETISQSLGGRTYKQ